MHFSDFSRSSDSSGSREARASMVRLLSYWQYYHRKISPSLESFIHLWSQGFHLSSIIKSSPSSSHYHHVITIIIKSTSPYHHVITIIITSSPPVSKDHIYHRISRKRLHQLKRFSNHGEKKEKKGGLNQIHGQMVLIQNIYGSDGTLWWLTRQSCLYICERGEMSHLWHTTHRQ